MTKFLSFAGAFLLVSGVNAQTTMQRVSLIEQVSSASCPPCASQNPAFNNFVSNNYSNSVKITYQRGGGSYIDPMWDFNPTETNGRIVTFYSTTWFPNTWINGTDYGAPNSVSQGDLDSENNTPATFHIDAQSQLINGNSEIKVDVIATSLQDYQSGPDNQTRIYIAVIENDVEYASAPGTNGETEFHWVMRKMLPDQVGTLIGQQTVGQMNTVSETWSIDLNEVDPNDLDVVVWVQNSSTGEVHQATRTSLASVGNPLGVEDRSIADAKVFPSVTDEQLTVGITLTEASDLTVNVLDATGKKVKEISTGSNLNVGYQEIRTTVDGLSNGLYYINIQSEDSRLVKKFVVAK